MDLLVAIRIYVRVVERGSMSAAARDLGIGQPAVSDRIQRLERHLNTKLLIRNTRKISMTEIGDAFYVRSKRVLESADEAWACVVDDIGRPLTGSLRIAAPHGLGEVALIQPLQRLREDHPQLEIDLIFNDAIIDPVTEGVDLSLRVGPTGQGSYVARRLGSVNRIIVASPSYLSRRAAPVAAEDLGAHPFIQVATQFCDGPLSLISPARSMVRPSINVAWRTSHWRAGLALLLDGCGIGVLQEPMCTHAIAEGKLVRLLPEYTLPEFDVHALYPTIRPLPRKIRAILGLLDEHFQGKNGLPLTSK